MSVIVTAPDRVAVTIAERERIVVEISDHGPPGPPGPQGPPGDITGDFPDFTLIFDNQLI